MTEQTEKDKKFNLEDWVTNRAANQAPAEREDKQVNAYQAPRSISGVITMTGNGAATAQVLRTPSQDMRAQDTNGASSDQNDTARPASSTAKPVVEPLRFASALGTASQQIQIVRLLQDLGDRLRASEKEREILWRELESTRKLIGDIDGKAEKVEKAYLTLENKVSSQPDHKNDIETQRKSLDEMMAEQKKLLDKISSLETTAGSTVVRVEDVLTENHKLAKRLDQVAQDKIRLQRKMDIMEETLTQTQDALKAKALVLLTDQALAQRTALPQVQAFTDQDKDRLAFLQQQNNNQQQTAQIGAHTTNKAAPNSASADSSSMVWWKQGANMFGNNGNMWRNVATVALIALGIAGGFALSKFTPAPSESNAEQVGDVEPVSGTKSQEELMADIATMANQIEPAAASDDGGEVVASTITSPETMDKIRASEEVALKNFESKMPAGDVSARIRPDKNLTGNAKELETKALAGDANAQHDLAALYSAGHAGVTADYKRAVQWFTESAHNEMPNAQYNLGVLKQQGLGTAQDTKGAIDLYRLAAMHNHAEAQYNLGIASIEGIGAEYDPSIAAYYFERAASNGIVEAAYNMGLIQENGLLGDSQPDEAVFWYKLGADKGHAESQKALAQLKTQLAMKDEDVTRIFNRIQALRPNALGNGAGAANASASNESAPAAANDTKTFIDNMKSMF